MSAETKTRAHEKLATFIPKIGYPDAWKDYSSLVVKSDDPVGNARRAAQWQWDYQVARLDKPVDRVEWSMTPQEINAYYNPLQQRDRVPGGDPAAAVLRSERGCCRELRRHRRRDRPRDRPWLR